MSVYKVNLHAHEAAASADSPTPAAEMVRQYELRNYDAVGFVGHGSLARVSEPSDLLVFNGIEWADTLSHVVAYPSHDLHFLAHPDFSPRDPEWHADHIAQNYHIDAIEKYNAGREQYSGTASIPELGNDDAHVPADIGRSYTLVQADRLTKPALVEAIKAGRVKAVNHPRSKLRQIKEWASKVKRLGQMHLGGTA